MAHTGYFTVGTNDLVAAVSFYDQIFRSVDIHRLIDFGERGIAWGVSWDKPSFAVLTPYDGQPATSFHAVCTTCGAQGPRDQGGRSGSGVCDASSCISSAMELWVRRVGG